MNASTEESREPTKPIDREKVLRDDDFAYFLFVELLTWATIEHIANYSQLLIFSFHMHLKG